MHPNAQDAIGRRLKPLLNALKVSPESVGLESPFDLQALKLLEEEAHKHFREWLRPLDVVLLVLLPPYALVGDLKRNGVVLPETRMLKDCAGAERMSQLFTTIMDEFKALPMTYTGFLLFPSMSSEGIGTCELAPGVRLIHGGELKEDPHFWPPRREPGELSLADAVRTVSARKKHLENVTFLACTVSGFYRAEATTTAAAALVSMHKQVLSLSQMIGLIERPRGIISLAIPSSVQAEQLIVRNESKGRYEEALALPTSMRTRESDLKFTDRIFEIRKGLLGGTQPLDKPARLQEVFKNAAVCFADAQHHIDILTAAEWASDAASEDNETLSYLYAAIGLEAILGAPEKEITSTLGDRLAYLIGRSRVERKKIQETFKKFYEHRSKIVHGKRARLGAEEVALVHWARSCIERAILRELSLVSA